MGISITDYFKMLGAPLKVQRTSWGAIREQDKVVFLRVWQDHDRQIDGAWYIKVLSPNWTSKSGNNHFGKNERAEHIKSLSQNRFGTSGKPGKLGIGNLGKQVLG